ncbi:MAG: Sec-independent protein translocase subunit TatA [Actinomycetales bacterium]|nr:Sec-independent protein translocase subunit TatA [Actinomycetales bacterium]
MFNNLKGWEWLIIVALILLLFGAKRLPDAARGLGRSLRIFKAETKGLTEDSAKEPSAPSPALGASSSSAAAAEAAPAEAPKPTEA